MHDDKLLRLIAAARESDTIESAQPGQLRREACLSMTRLRWLATADCGATATESAHLSACAICAARLSAWQGRRTKPRSRRVLHFVAQSAAVAAAILVTLLMRPVRPDAPAAPHAPLAERHVAARIGGLDPVQLVYLPGVQPCDERVDQFCPTTREECAILAVFRAWREECDCMAWEVHRWDNGEVVMRAEPGDAPPINRAVTGASASMQQMLILAVASRSNQLPGVDEADELIDCLNASDVSTWDGGAETYSSAVAGCLPDSVTVVPQAFVVNCD